ncbi:alpha/beta hydrolase [Solwaraspora sp. WMMD406]|uniref:alpha/beta hydrolase family protein n=1 Tax=Solwaraspora sp. WMMD406 TaxID=3016095 RepID=UPI002415F7EC|nr:alpha/beta family hydrolase [Solwaraspora sp. WMMD406]MDG4767639.1 alpha/beta hydrolase [Solwaraspora sp. WMMD406]
MTQRYDDPEFDQGWSRRRQTVPTPRGPAWIDLVVPPIPLASLLVLGHGAGGDVTAADLSALCSAAACAAVAVARVTQPYRVAGRRAPAPAGHLDEAWRAVVARLAADFAVAGSSGGVPPLIVGGRSSGARVACRTAAQVSAAGVIALAFPLHPPGRPERTRAGELVTGLPTLVVNGERDPFGVPPAGPDRDVVVRPGERHDLRGDPEGVAGVVVDWLAARDWARR